MGKIAIKTDLYTFRGSLFYFGKNMREAAILLSLGLVIATGCAVAEPLIDGSGEGDTAPYNEDLDSETVVDTGFDDTGFDDTEFGETDFEETDTDDYDTETDLNDTSTIFDTDTVSDTETVPDTDECPDDDQKLYPGLCGCGVVDVDGDEDGTPDCNDDCPEDSNKTAPGTCGCGETDTDGDSDGTADCQDGCPEDPNKIASGTCGCGVAEGNCGESTWIYEAEDRTADQGVSLSSGNPGYLGTGYMDYGGAGAFVEWNNVVLPQSGTYTLDFRYATSFYSRSSTLSLNGVDQFDIPFGGVAGSTWSDWRVNTVTATLPAGTNTIRITSINSGPNLDRMTITSGN